MAHADWGEEKGGIHNGKGKFVSPDVYHRIIESKDERAVIRFILI